MNNFDLLKESADKVGLDVSRETFEKFEIYKSLLIEWNKKINLTAITKEDEIYKKHFIDSINIYSLKEIVQCKTVIDVGTGAGFPGLPMKIMNNDIELTLLDPLNKRINFLKEVSNQLGLSKVKFIHGRAEDVSRETLHRDKYDLAVSRAVATFPIISEYCLPFVKTNGFFVALKGPNIQLELDLDKAILQKLSAKLLKIETSVLEDTEHNLVLVKKTSPTKNIYPRKNALIKKDADHYRSLK